MPSLDELNLLPENPPAVDLNSLPEQRAGEYYMPQPGDYIWTLPKDVSDVFATIPSDAGQRIAAKFSGHKSLVNERGEKLMVDVKNNEFKDAKGNVYNDFAYLLQALGFTGVLDDNAQYIKALSGQGEQKFRAELTWTARSRATGQKFGQRAFEYKQGPKAGTKVLQIEKIGGKFQQEFLYDGECIRCFPALRNFRPYSE